MATWMDEYIKREYAVDAVVDVYYNTPDIDLSGEKLEAAILKIPPSDVEPVRHGRWGIDGVYVVCSVCNRLTLSPIVKRPRVDNTSMEFNSDTVEYRSGIGNVVTEVIRSNSLVTNLSFEAVASDTHKNLCTIETK